LWWIWPIAIVSIDQVLKYFALSLKDLPGMTFALWQNVFHLTYAENTGAAFSMLRGSYWILVSLQSVLILAILIFLIIKGKKIHPLMRLSLAWVLGGALGNLIDRIRIGHVVDYLDFRLINFAIFNFADCFITCGAILLGIYLVFIEGRQKEHGK
jgi:signal peptidase II